MPDSGRLLELIERGVVEHGGDLGGWTSLNGDALQLFDGRVTLRAELTDAGPSGRKGVVHAHLLATLHEYDDEVLDACVFGIGGDEEEALGQVAVVWLTAVAGPIRSFLDKKPVCMTCQAGVQGGDPGEGYCQGDYGLPNLLAYVGPSIGRGNFGPDVQPALDDTKPWFRFAAEAAAPRGVHLAKASVVARGKAGWSRDLEIDGHEVSFKEENWPAGVTGPDAGYLVRYAVFEFPRNSTAVRQRAELERTILHYAENHGRFEDTNELRAEMVEQGFDPDLVHQTETVATIAFGRVLLERFGVKCSPTVIRARADGRIQIDVPLLSLPAYNRARAIAARLEQTMPDEAFQSLALYSAEANAFMKAVEAHGGKFDQSGLRMGPSVVPDLGVSDETMKAAVAVLQAWTSTPPPAAKKPWWKFW